MNRTLVTHRFENARPDVVFLRELTRDGLKVRVLAASSSPAGKVTVLERWAERFPDEAHAVSAFERALAEARRNFKTEKRLERVVPLREEGLGVVAENPALEERVRVGRDADSARVYADWLQAQGDVRGELAALLQAGNHDAANAWLDENADRVLGEHDVRLHADVYDLVWRHGFLEGASLRRSRFVDEPAPLDVVTKGVLELPLTRLVRQLTFGLASYDSDNDWTATMRAVTQSAQAKQLVTLRFSDFTSEDGELSFVPFGDFSPAWAALPSLEELVVRSGAGGTLGALRLPSLRRFVRISGGLSAGELESITQAKWPALEHLEVWTGQAEYGAEATTDLLEPLFSGANTPALTSLGLVNCEVVHECLEPIARSKLLPRLKRLDLSRSALQDRDVPLLLKHVSAFQHLELLDLCTNQLSDEGVERVKAVLPKASLSDQRERYDDDETRYAAVGE